MKQLRTVAKHLLATLHLTAHTALGAAVLVSVLLAGAAWRLAQGPVDLSWLTARLEASVNTPDSPIRVHIGHTALAWEGFRLGVDRPMDLRLTDVTVTDTADHQRLAVPQAELSLALGALLVGRLQPRAIELDRPRLLFRRNADGAISLDLGGVPDRSVSTDHPRTPDLASPPGQVTPPGQAHPTGQANPTGQASPAEQATRPGPAAAPDQASPADQAGRPGRAGLPAGSPLPRLLAELARPPASDRTAMRGWISQIRRVRIHDAAVTLQDAQNGVTWQSPQAEIDLTREPAGGVRGSADLALALADQHARLHATATLSASATQTRITADLTPVAPAALARLVPSLAPLAALNAPVSVETSLLLGPTLGMRQFGLTLRAGAGQARIGQSSIPVVAATLTAAGTPDAVRIESARVLLRGHSGGTPTALTATGTLSHNATRLDATLSLALDQVDFADLPSLWPAGIAEGARKWVIDNITAGSARDARVQVALTANDDGSGITLTEAEGTLEGQDLTVHWLRPVPPLVDGQAELRILGPDALEIAVRGGHQTLRSGTGGLTLKGGSMRITGLMEHEQFGSIRAEIAGSVPDTLALLREPRLHLLSDHKMKLANASGRASGTLSVHLPLSAKVSMDDVAIQANAQLDGLHLDDVAAGRPLNQGRLDLTATNDGLTIKGNAQLAGIPAQLDAAMDFRAGGPAQVVQHVIVTGRAGGGELAAAGLDSAGMLSGPVPLRVDLTERRDGVGTLAVQADLTPASLQVAGLAWRKPPGSAATASVQLHLLHDRLTGIDHLAATGDGLSLQGEAACTDGRIALVRLNRLVLGRSDLRATVQLPATSNTPIAVDVTGPVLDLSARLERPHRPSTTPPTDPPPGPPWTLDARFDRVLMAHGYLLSPVTVQADNDGRVFRRLSVAGATRDHGPFDLRIASAGGRRRLTASVVQTGDLLRALDWIKTMQGGRLTVTGTYDDSKPGHPLSGTAELTDFRVREAAALGKLLQAMTLYGLVDALHGPGLAFNRAVVPFSLTPSVLELANARAFSSSLGLTAKGRINLDADRVDVQGTIVPAYFFNSLLGRLPLVGKLLSPERGGGVFAASYALRGKLDDPDVSVNPLTALTPGFLRGLFGAF